MPNMIDPQDPQFIAYFASICRGYELLADYIRSIDSPSVYSDLQECTADIATGLIGIADAADVEHLRSLNYALEADDEMMEYYCENYDIPAPDEVIN